MKRPTKFRRLLTELKSGARSVLGLPDPWKQFRVFESRIHPETWSRQAEILEWLAHAEKHAAETESPAHYEAASDPVVRESHDLFKKLKARFENKFRGSVPEIRVLACALDMGSALGGASLYRNFAQGFQFLGIETRQWQAGTPLAPQLETFKPNVLLAIDERDFAPGAYLEGYDWEAIRNYRRQHELKIGLQLHPYEVSAATMNERFERVKAHAVDFFYAFQSPDFIRARFAPWLQRGYRVLNFEFGANPLIYYPVPRVERDLNYVFLGSTNGEKWPRYFAYFSALLARSPGIIVGPGWPRSAVELLSDAQQRYLYARARIGLNLHVPFQIESACELNERAYNLAISGVPQLTDAPPLLPQRFGPKSFFAADSPSEYEALFRRILESPAEAQERALNALRETFERHTVFHRTAHFIEEVAEFIFRKAG